MDMCKKIQELILTDYLDGEINEASIDKHIASCEECRKFIAVVKKTTVEPLKNSKKDVLSQEIVWSKIQKEISKEKIYSNEYDDAPSFFEKIKESFFLPNPTLAIGSFAVLIFMILVLNFKGNQSQLVKINQSEGGNFRKTRIIDVQSENSNLELYLAYLIKQENDFKDYGTSLEEYFL